MSIGAAPTIERAILDLQRTAGNAAVAAALAGRNPAARRPTVQRAPSKIAMGSGTFEARHYEAFKTESPDHKVGAGLILTFTPALQVDAPTRIGLVQTIKHTESPVHVDTRAVMPTLGEGGKWQEKVVTQSPVYAALNDPKDPLHAAPTLADTADPKKTLGGWKTMAHKDVEASKVEESGHYKNAAGVENPPLAGHLYQTGEIAPDGKATVAALTDTPGFAANSGAAKEAWAWEAEVVATALSGPIAGTYLGSVGWGWRYDPPGQPDTPTSARLAPENIETRHENKHSRDFATAAFTWNVTPVEDPETKAIVPMAQLPLTGPENKEMANQLAQAWGRSSHLIAATEARVAHHEGAAGAHRPPDSERAFMAALSEELRSNEESVGGGYLFRKAQERFGDKWPAELERRKQKNARLENLMARIDALLRIWVA